MGLLPELAENRPSRPDCFPSLIRMSEDLPRIRAITDEPTPSLPVSRPARTAGSAQVKKNGEHQVQTPEDETQQPQKIGHKEEKVGSLELF